jgi:hypothetical protein
MMMTGEYTPTETDLEHISELNTLVQYLNEQALNFTSDEARKAHTKLKAFLYGGRSP